MRTCTKCNSEKTADEFHKSSAHKDGIHPWCKECRKQSRAAWADKNPEAALDLSRKWAAENPEKQRARVKRWRLANPEKSRIISRRHHHKHKDERNAASAVYNKENREKLLVQKREWSKNNPAKYMATQASRRAKKYQATPAWAKRELDKFIVKEMYSLAALRTKKTGIKWQVDHVVPLKNKLVCGLHCAANLEVIPAVTNHIKGNRVWPDMP